MKAFFTIILLLGVSLSAAAQQQCGGSPVYGVPIIFVTSTPSGSCRQTDPLQKLCSTGDIYTCANVTAGVGTWELYAGGGTGGINQLTGDVLAGPGSGSVAATAAATAVIPGTYSKSTITVDSKGRVTSASSGPNGSSAPPWIKFLGDGSDGANTTASGNLSGDYFYTNFTVPFGNTVTVNSINGLTIHATGTCTIAGTITAAGANAASTGTNSGSGGGGGGGTAAGATGTASTLNATGTSITGGTAGASSGGNGSSGSSMQSFAGTASLWKVLYTYAGLSDGIKQGYGAHGGTGGSTGGAGGSGAASIVLICSSITGTDGTNVGSVTAGGTAGGNSTGNNVGAGGGGAGGMILMYSAQAVSTWPTTSVAGGNGGTCGAFTGCGTGGMGGAGVLAEWSQQ